MNAALDHPATGHTTVGAMRANGGRTALKVSHITYPSLAFTTPSGKIAFHAQRAADMGLAALPSYTAGHAGQGGLALAHGRTFAHFHAFYDHGRALPTLAAREDTPELWISVADAAQRGIVDAAEIDISNARGSFGHGPR